jgi:hypothetical protein
VTEPRRWAWILAAAVLAGLASYLHFSRLPGADDAWFKGASVASGLLMAALIRGPHRLGALPRLATFALIALLVAMLAGRSSFF